MISERLSALRLAAGKSQQEVADELHMTRSAYSSYETGRRTPPLDVLIGLARHFGTTTDYLLGLSEEAQPLPVMDERGRAVIRLYQDADPRGQSTIYHLALQEKIGYGAEGAETPEAGGSSPKA